MLPRSSLLGPSLAAPPQRVQPKAAEIRYQSRLKKLATGAISRAYSPLLKALPRLAAAATIAQAGGAQRADASPVDEAADLARGAEGAFSKRFEADVAAEARRAAGNVSAHSKTQLRAQLAAMERPRLAGIQLTDSPRLRPIIDGFVAENVSLIRGIGPRLQSDVQAIVVAGLTGGVPAARLAKQIEERLGVAANRASLIAIDQIGKLDGQLTAQRTQDLGVTHFYWRISNDERVRGNPDGLYPKAKPDHWARRDIRYAYADPPRGKNGEVELPGTPIRCRCWQDPDFSTIGAATAPDEETAQAAPGALPPAAPATEDVEELEAEAARMLAEVEAMIAAAEKPPPPPPSPEPVEAAATMLDMQLDVMDDDVVEAALKRRLRRKRKRGAQPSASP